MNAMDRPEFSPAIDKLNSWKHYRLVLLVAPPGAGKTALLWKWVKEIDRSTSQNPAEMEPVRVAWIDLKPQDNEPRRFLADLVVGLEATGFDGKGFEMKRVLENAGLIPLPGSPATEDDRWFDLAMTVLANALTKVRGELILVLDHYHHIQASVIHSAVAQLLDYPPPQVHLVIATRSEPPLPLPRLRARRQMVDVLPADLQIK